MSATTNKKTLGLTIAAIGVVYGDLGTSPLYAFRESLSGLSVVSDNIFGVLSLIFWSLILIVSLKYLVFVLRADNDGEGGVLALLALIKKSDPRAFKLFFYTAIMGTALLISDGMITPAISVVSAIEGLSVITPSLSHLTLPITCIILVSLYVCQHYGTAKIGNLFGPILIIWFISIGLLGFTHIVNNPIILKAINPYYAINFFVQNGWKGYMLLGAVFLVVTGGEALYADLGQFGKTPIRYGWFGIALPGLLLNYFGQGAYVLSNPSAIVNPFYSMAPSWSSYPLLIIATLATIIASQAVISATFSLTKQAVLLDLYPKIRIIQTSSEEKGQIYVPQMNVFLAIGTLTFLAIFKNSSAMTFAYGIAVNLVMLSVTILLIYVALKIWQWSLIKILALFSVILLIECAFLGANLHKITSGGWVPITFSLFAGTIMVTWYKGMKYLRTSYYKEKGTFESTLSHIKSAKMSPVPKSFSVFITDPYDDSSSGILQYLKLNHFMPEVVLITSIIVENDPYISRKKRFELTQLSPHIYRLMLHVGFMQLIDIPKELAHAARDNVFHFDIDLNHAAYLVQITNISPTLRKRTLPFFWQEKLFAFLMRNSTLDIEFYHLPYERTIAIGNYCEI